MLYAADFENTIDNMYSTYVWSAGICNVKTKEYEVFENIDDFIDYIKLNVEEKSTIYFHNLNYDINFLLAYLNKNYYEEVPANKRGWIDFNCGYNIIATIEGVFYQLTVQFDTGKQVRFRDSLKLVNSSLEKMGKDLGIPEEVQKLTGTIDYGKHRDEGYHMTDIERQYQINDVLALAYCIEKMEEMGLTECMTAAAFAMRQYKKILYLQDHKGASENQKGFARSVREYFERVFPVLDDEVDKFIRSSYRGGFCYCNADSEKIYKQDLYVYDVNSMYPAQMFGVTDGTNTYGGKFPVGEPHWFNSLDELPDGIMYFVRLNAWFEVKDGYIPFIQLKNNRMFQENEYVKDSEGYQEITLTKQDYELFLKHYNIIDMEVIGGYWFYTRDNLFTDYINKFYAMKDEGKRTGNKTKTALAKICLNSLYGKFGTRGNRPVAHVEYDDKNILHISAHRDANGVLDELEGDTIYIPVASTVTAYARKYIVSSAQENYDNFLYSDTDSLHLSAPAKGIWVDKYELGAWDLESTPTIGRYVRQKTYIEYIDGEWDLKACGMPQQCKELAIEKYGDDIVNVFGKGFEVEGKLSRKRVSGGVILFGTTFTIK